jgi:hypothetical protein
MASYKEGQKFPHCDEGDPSILTGQIIFPTLVGVDSLAKTAIVIRLLKAAFRYRG